MDVNQFRYFWEQHFANCPPVSYLFRHRLTDRWFRFHSLSESKRYAKDETEVEQLLQRQNTALLDIIGEGKCVLVSGNYSSSPSLEEQCSALSNFEFQEFLKLSKQDFDPEQLEPNEEPVYLSLFCGTHDLKYGSLNDVLLCIADWKIVNFFVLNCNRERIFAPYDGGVDVILRNLQERDKFRAKYKDWLSLHPEGL
ncbi:DUF3885 domain-containing protein [Leptolyngbya sp. AN03gr2]|uniref:DUF3885 domain-containing protein n=1 Tax=unclassified Leptolyngbya TaxID=2650499 RepID=UPI003D322303